MKTALIGLVTVMAVSFLFTTAMSQPFPPGPPDPPGPPAVLPGPPDPLPSFPGPFFITATTCLPDGTTIQAARDIRVATFEGVFGFNIIGNVIITHCPRNNGHPAGFQFPTSFCASVCSLGFTELACTVRTA